MYRKCLKLCCPNVNNGCLWEVETIEFFSLNFLILLCIMFYVFMFKSFIMILYYFYKTNNLENLKTKSVEKSHSVSRTFFITFP